MSQNSLRLVMNLLVARTPISPVTFIASHTMYIPHASIIISTMAFSAAIHAGPSLSSPPPSNQGPSKRASSPQPGPNLMLPVPMKTNSSLPTSNNNNGPREIECYTQEPGGDRPFITYDSCLLLFTRVSSQRIFRKQQEYSPGHAKTPWIWRSGRDCEIQVWTGKVSEASEQYVMAMAAWYVNFFSICNFFFSV